jgi:hypothetical protein
MPISLLSSLPSMAMSDAAPLPASTSAAGSERLTAIANSQNVANARAAGGSMTDESRRAVFPAGPRLASFR